VGPLLVLASRPLCWSVSVFGSQSLPGAVGLVGIGDATLPPGCRRADGQRTLGEVVFGLLGWTGARRGEANNRNMAGISTVLGALVAVLGIIGISITFSAVDKSCKTSAVTTRLR
jgi:hypothetical protein